MRKNTDRKRKINEQYNNYRTKKEMPRENHERKEKLEDKSFVFGHTRKLAEMGEEENITSPDAEKRDRRGRMKR